MIRVIIADDETRICKLIIKLIHWDKLDMLIVGTANNGIEALELIEKENPDIVITDIRMPGYDGLDMIEKAKKINNTLEFIIISGYGQFEYAKRAIEFGVKEYLLKPINKEDLYKTLLKVGEHVKKNKYQSSLEKEYELILKNDANRIRESFLSNFLFYNSEGFKEYTIKEINENHHFHFQEGFFSIAALKLDYRSKEDLGHIKTMMNEIVDMIKSKLQNITYEVDSIRNKNNLYIVMNYNQKKKKQMEAVFLRVLEYFNQRISTAEKLEVTVALGEEVKELKDIAESFESAKLLIEDRILKGTRKIIKLDKIRTDNTEIEDVFSNFSKKFIKAVEVLDGDEVKKLLLNFKRDISFRNIRGTDLKRMINEIGSIYYITMKNNNMKIDHVPEDYTKLKITIEDCNSIDGLFNLILNYITSSLSVISENKPHNHLRQIREAKKYIEENYMKNITLEDLGVHIGFSPSYFSSLFKKETGTSFIEYLSKVRVEKAKDLLKESDLRIQDICLMVGYHDAKYFTKSFIKHTGLKPNEYRKIFA
ncbi:two-component system, response regulator YesN [Natronincola peptidivorans]|uniref:Stage 0 sporulation protein A homolog n=1 Tax=Natronincola peptidivorans TaxID=426128 RepID=A0A1I0B1T2_9FIRM|nr:response regulator [Natronincola peptidivorans]SET00031.1 two-component system, response regulator YesN [Natronincola peptidivorans]